jgi:hypothetical protein
MTTPSVEQTINTFIDDCALAHQFVNGGPHEFVQTANGPVPTFANIIASNQAVLLVAGVIGPINAEFSTTASNQVLDVVPANAVRSMEYLVQIASGSSYQVSKFILIQDGTNVVMNEYAVTTTGILLATFDADIVDGVFRFLISPVNTSTTVRALRTVLSV